MTSIALTVAAARISVVAGTASVTATVTNTSSWDERVVLAALPSPATPSTAAAPAAETWTRVERAVRDIPAGQTEQYTVTMTPPAGLPAGAYLVRLVAYSAKSAPEENTDQARTVEVTVPGTPVATEPAGRPWWLVAVLAALVLVAALVAYLVLKPNGTPTAAPTGTPSATKQLCRAGLVPRLSRPGDNVCVSPAVAKQAAYENDPDVQKARKNDPPGGPYGPDTCQQGFVWRDAFDGDHACVTGETRTRTAQENLDAPANAGPDAGP